MFYNIQVTKTNGVNAQTVFAFDTIDTAKANHHYFLSSSYSNTNLEYFMGEIVDADGNLVTREVWYKPQPEPDPETDNPNAE